MEEIKTLHCVVWADYRPYSNNCPKYEFRLSHNMTHNQIKKWFETVYSWLDVKKIEWKGEVKEYE